MEQTMIGRYLAAREKAAARGDRGLVVECDVQLARYGYRPDAAPSAVERAERAADADARPSARPASRRSKAGE